MTELSPAAKAILEAYDNSPWEYDTGDLTACAAVLRAAVAHTQQHRGFDVWECDADELLAIADELEAT